MRWKKISYILFLLVAMCFGSISYADSVWIDVRSVAEHSADNIEGDVRISHSEIVQYANTKFTDKGTEIRLYCRSGRRAGRAMEALIEAGYTNVSNMGGIDDARKQRGLID